MTSIAFNSLKKKTNIIDIPENTMDLVNGLFLTVNTTIKDFDYASSFEILPEIVCKLYDCLGIEAYSLQPKVIVPTSKDIDYISVAGQILGVSSIGLNRTGEKTHIHFWFYNIHSFNLNYQSFCIELKKNLRCLKGISKRNEFSVKLLPCIDPVDNALRQSNHNNQTIVDYIAKREYNSLMNYFTTKNNKNFIYFY
jgi:hypothetical protein